MKDGIRDRQFEGKGLSHVVIFGSEIQLQSSSYIQGKCFHPYTLSSTCRGYFWGPHMMVCRAYSWHARWTVYLAREQTKLARGKVGTLPLELFLYLALFYLKYLEDEKTEIESFSQA